MGTITARVKKPRDLLKAAQGWTENGGLIIDGHEFTVDMRRRCGQMIALKNWSGKSGQEYRNNRVFTAGMLEKVRN